MLLQEFQDKFKQQIKKGEFVRATWKSGKTINGKDYSKVSNGVVRFVKYGNINGVQVKGQTNPNEQVIIPNVLIYNKNTQTYYVQMGTTTIKAKSTYYENGVEITKQDYEMVNKPRKTNGQPNPVFRVKLENLISLG